MKLSVGIVGLPNVGKSTLFKSLTRQDIHIANYPFATIDPNVGIVEVPDSRLQTLTQLSESKKTIPAIVEFYDIAGLVRGASTGQGLGNQFLSHIKEVHAIAHVVRCFENSDITHVEQSPHPARDIDTINHELILKDLELVEKRLNKVEGEARTGDKAKKKELDALRHVKDVLEKETMPYMVYTHEELETEPLKELNLLTAKPQIFILNGSEQDVSDETKEKIASLNATYIILDLSLTTDISDVITKAYAILNLISFFTTGEDETRAWTIEKGSKAPQAAGTIHTDFEDKFIRAEVVAYDDFVAAGGWGSAKQKGKLRIEGKEYVVQDGDVMVIRHG